MYSSFLGALFEFSFLSSETKGVNLKAFYGKLFERQIIVMRSRKRLPMLENVNFAVERKIAGTTNNCDALQEKVTYVGKRKFCCRAKNSRQTQKSLI